MEVHTNEQGKVQSISYNYNNVDDDANDKDKDKNTPQDFEYQVCVPPKELEGIKLL